MKHHRFMLVCNIALHPGFYMLPVSSLIEPPEKLLVRETSKSFIDGLKAEMLENPTSDVQPILAVVQLDKGKNL